MSLIPPVRQSTLMPTSASSMVFSSSFYVHLCRCRSNSSNHFVGGDLVTHHASCGFGEKKLIILFVDHCTSARITRVFFSAVTATLGRQPHNQEALPRPVPKLVGCTSCIYCALSNQFCLGFVTTI